MAEAFVGTLKTECVDGKIYRSRFDAELAIVLVREAKARSEAANAAKRVESAKATEATQ